MQIRFPGSLALALAALALTHPLEAGQGQAPRSGAPTVVIVPFANLTGEPADAWIGAGIAESLATGFPAGATVMASLPSPDAGGGAAASGEDPASFQAIEIGRRLGGHYVVSGTYQRLGDAVRITGRLVDLATGYVFDPRRSTGHSPIFSACRTESLRIWRARSRRWSPPQFAQRRWCPLRRSPSRLPQARAQLGEHLGPLFRRVPSPALWLARRVRGSSP